MDPRITLSDIVKWEKLRDKSFMKFVSTDIDDITTLMYVHDHSNQREYTREFYCQLMAKKIKEGKAPKELTKFLRMAEKDLEYVNQFSKRTSGETEGTEANGDALKEPEPLTPAIMSVMFEGIDPQWLMCQGLDMLPILTEGYAEKKHREYENERFWATLEISPHVKKSSFNNLMKSLKAPWENAKKGLDKITQQDVNLAHAIFGTKKKDQ